MNRINRFATRYGNWVVNTRLPQWKYIRRLAASNPRDYAVYAFWNVVVAGMIRSFHINLLRREIKKLKAENARLKEIKVTDLLHAFVTEAKPSVKDKL